MRRLYTKAGTPMNPKLKEKVSESLSAVLPITAIVLIVSLFVDFEISMVMMFLVGALMLIFGMGFFQLGAEMSAIPNMMLIMTVAVGVGVFLAMAVLRILFKINLSTLLMVLYSLLIVFSYFIPKEFTAIAFDSGGVASGPMTSTFLLPLSAGACKDLGGNIMTEAFGVVSLVALTPLLPFR